MLHAQGTPVANIARQLGVSRPTVDAYLRRTMPPSPKRPQCQWTAQVLTPSVPYLIRRWREIRALGSTHSARTVSRFITSPTLVTIDSVG
jgi:transposase